LPSFSAISLRLKLVDIVRYGHRLHRCQHLKDECLLPSKLYLYSMNTLLRRPITVGIVAYMGVRFIRRLKIVIHGVVASQGAAPRGGRGCGSL